MPKPSGRFAKTTFLLLVIVCTLMIQAFQGVEALILQSRSVVTSTAITSAANVTHSFQFTVPNTDPMGSIVFEYCANSPIISVACNAPAGLNVQTANLTTQTGNTGFIIHVPSTTANKLVLTRSPSGSLAVPSSYVFDNITNPSTANATTYIRISTYVTANGSGAYTHNGSVAFATIAPFSVNTSVPPFLILCVAITVAVDCSSMSGGNSLDLGVLTSTATKSGASQFAVGTNSLTGYNVYVLGTTMTSGNNVIPAVNPAASSQAGTSQFGINLRANTSPSVGQDPGGLGSGNPQAGYNTPNAFKLQSGDLIAAASLPTDYRHMTVSYIANVSSAQAPGIYSTTLTYLATAQF